MDETQQVFRQARESFLAGLPRDEKAAFEQLGSSVTRADLLHSLEQLLTGFGSDKSDRIFQKISSFSDSIKVYFQVIDTVISSHPEVAAIIWGVARFIFQLASNYTTFFQKLANLIEELTVVLPRFEDLLCLEKDLDLTQRLRLTVARFYKDLLEFFRDVLSIFRRKNGKTKAKGLIAMTLLWQPFDVKFGNIVSRMRQHREVVAEETAYLILSRVQQTYKLQSQYSASSIEWRKTIEQNQEQLKTLLGRGQKEETDEQVEEEEEVDEEDEEEVDEDEEGTYEDDDSWFHDPLRELVSGDLDDLASQLAKLHVIKEKKRSGEIAVELATALNQYHLLVLALRSLHRARKNDLRTALQEDPALNETSMMAQVSDTLRSQDQQTFVKLSADMENHRTILADIQSKLSSFSDESATRDIIQFVNPPEFMQELEKSCHERHGGTGHWFLDTGDFARWANPKDTTNVLWVQGKPGMGKSTLAGLVIKKLQQSERPNREKGVSYFFFRAGHAGLASVDDCSRALLAQMLKDRLCGPPLAKAASFAMFSKDHAQLRASPAVIYDLLALGCRMNSSRQFILDGLDECNDPDDKISRLLGIFQKANVRTMIFSRPSMECLRRIAEAGRSLVVPLSILKMGKDIAAYSHARIKEFVDARLLPRDVDLGILVAQVTRGANGMFLWVRLLFTYLQSPMLAPPHIAPRVRLQHIMNLRYPETLDQMYHRVFDILQRAPDYQRDLARRVFKWLLFQKTTLDALELHDVLNTSYIYEASTPTHAEVISMESEPYDISAGFEEFKESIIIACSSLVELTSTERPSYCFAHHSVTEYLLTRLRTSTSISSAGLSSEMYFVICEREAESDLAAQCLTYLTRHMPPRPLSGNIQTKPNKQIVQSQTPFLKYAVLYFSAHLNSSSDHRKPCCNYDMFKVRQELTCGIFKLFLESKLTIMVWVEALYLLQPHPGAMLYHKTHLLAWADGLNSSPSLGQTQGLQKDIGDFSADMSELDDLWGERLRSSSEQIWLDVTAFTKTRFLMQTRGVEYTSLAPKTLGSAYLAKTPLCTVSSGSASSEFLGVLSIWPSREFEKTWHQGHWYALCYHCTGWVAQHQIWSINEVEPQVQHEVTLTIDSVEVETQVVHFLRVPQQFEEMAATNKIKLRFPISVHPTKPELFSILRTIYRIDKGDPKGATPFLPSWDSALLSLHWNGVLKSVWESSLPARDEAHQFRRGDKIKYRYGVQFIEQLDCILYHDTSATQRISPKFQMASTLAIFQLPKDGFGGGPIRPFYFLERSPLDYGFSHWTFHPSLPLIALNTYQIRGFTSILLWHHRPDGPSDEASVATAVEWDNGGFFDIEKLCFSESGEEILIQRDATVYVRICPIKDHPIYRNALQHSKREQSHDPLVHSHETGLVQPSSAIYSSNESGTALYRTRDKHGNDFTQNLTVDNSHRAGIEIGLVRQQEQLRTSQPILSLPNWRSTSSIDVSISVPLSREEKLKIILNKPARPSYTMTSRNDTNLPAVVFKDQRILSTGTTIDGKRATPARVNGVFSNATIGESSSSPRRVIEESKCLQDKL